jgi:hypothetical protein
MRQLALIRGRLADEQGIALVLAVVILAIITIAAASAIFYTQGSQSDAYSKKGGQTAYSLAQAALSNATAELLPLYYDSSGQPFDNTTSLTTMESWTAPSGSKPSGCSATNPGTGCTIWQAELCPGGVCPSGYTTGLASAYEQAVWHITGIGAVFNPSGTKPITRTITINVPLLQPPAKAPAPDIFKIVYSGKTSTGCDFSTGQGVVFGAPVYVAGNMCVGQHSGVEQGPQNQGQLNVGGWLELPGQGAHVGTSSAPLSSVTVGGVCTTSGNVPPPSGQPCATTLTQSGGVYTGAGGTIFTYSVPSSVTWPHLTPLDFSPATNQGDVSCTGGRSLTAPSGGTFVLNGSSYSCTASTAGVQTGSLSWDGTTLKISGNVYINGNLVTNSPNQQMVFQGLGTIYATGTASFANNTAICADQTDYSGHSCPDGATWPDIADNFLMIASQGGTSGANFNLEGGLYSAQSIDFGSGQTNIYGPVVTPDQIFPGQQAAVGFPNILDLFTGLPGTPQPFWVLALPQNGTY